MVAYILESSLQQTKALADFITTLSEGNPLFVSESLSYLHNKDLLFLNADRQWLWDMEKIRRSHMPPTVVALFASKIKKLSQDLISLLEYCACMGNTFSPAELAAIREKTLAEIFVMLKPALGLGLLMESKGQLQFIHDKVQEAALSAIAEEKRRRIHWQIGTHLLSAVPEGAAIEKLENLFIIVSHLNLGRESAPDPKTAYLLSDLNYYTGNKAMDSLAMEAANEHFNTSRELLPDDCWEGNRYERSFRIFQKTAKTELMCGRYENSEKLLGQLLEHAKTDLDKAECLAEQTTSLSSIGNFTKAIETANRGLAYFNKSIPDDPETADARRKILMAEIAAEHADVWTTILNMPFTKERKSKIELKFYSELIPDLYMSGLVPQLYLSAAQSTRHCLAGGMDESVIYSFSIMGLQLGEQGDFEQAFKYEDLARALSAKYPDTFGATRGMNGIVWCNAHSRSHPKEIVEYCLKSIQCGKNCGDLYNAGLSYGPLMWNLQVQGADMSAIEDYARECTLFSNRYHLAFSAGLAEAMQAGWIAPMKAGYSPVDMEEKLKQWEKDNHVASAGSYCVHMALAHYYSGEHEKAQEYLEKVRRYLTGLTDNVLKRQWYVFLALNALRLYEHGCRSVSKDVLLAEIHPLLEKVETWSRLGPLLKPYLAFLRAELEKVTGGFREARSLYLDAINAAHRQEYTFLEGYLNECLGELLKQADLHSWEIYFTEAARLYGKCRAERKEAALREKYPQYLREAAAAPGLDVAYLMKASLAISAEMEQDTLLKKIMDVVIESSSAQHGYLLIESGNALFVRAESHIADKQGARTVDSRLEAAEDVCKAIVRYVHRTGTKVLLDNAREEGMFKNNPEVQELQLRSVLCLPVIKQAKIIGVLYLENRLSDSVFTPERTLMTELLTSQAAISFENARLVKGMKDIREIEDAYRAILNILEDMNAERDKLDTTQRALINMLEDIEMERNKSEQANRLLQSANKELEAFSYSVSHDLRAPLRGIDGFTALVLENNASRLDARSRNDLQRARTAAQHMGRLIDGLLNLARVSRNELHRMPVNLSVMAREIEAQLRTEQPGQVVQFLVEENLTAVGDPLLLREGLENLLRNAWKFTSGQTAARIEFGAVTRGRETAYFVRDNGAGFEMKYIEKLFRPFQRLHKATEFGGTGIGLAIVQRVIQRHGGRVWAESATNKGSTFYFTLPSESSPPPPERGNP